MKITEDRLAEIQRAFDNPRYENQITTNETIELVNEVIQLRDYVSSFRIILQQVAKLIFLSQ